MAPRVHYSTSIPPPDALLTEKSAYFNPIYHHDNIPDEKPSRPRWGIPTIPTMVHLIPLFCFLVPTIVLGVLDGPRGEFWGVFPEFMIVLCSNIFWIFAEFVHAPTWWRRKARELVRDGYLQPGTVVLNVCCYTGPTIAHLVQAVREEQHTSTSANPEKRGGHTELDLLFVGLDQFTKWHTIPASPARLLYNMQAIGLARDNIVVHKPGKIPPCPSPSRSFWSCFRRTPPETSHETPTRSPTPTSLSTNPSDFSYVSLPFASDSIPLIVTESGLSAATASPKSRTQIVRELVRVLKPGGRLIITDQAGTDLTPFAKMLREEYHWGGPKTTKGDTEAAPGSSSSKTDIARNGAVRHTVLWRAFNGHGFMQCLDAIKPRSSEDTNNEGREPKRASFESDASVLA